jgi:glycosyltransferase involved in cell wall biosynthesis
VSHTPRVSIGLPTYSRAGLLPRALDALLAQEYRDFELIVSDNASPDDTERVVRERAAFDPRVRYVRQPTNLGMLANFAFVLDQARGEYFMWAADDDEWDPRYLATLVAHLDGDPRLSLCSTEVRRVDQQGAPLDSPAEGQEFRPSTRRRAPFSRLWHAARHHRANQVYGLFRREALARPRNAYWALQRHDCYCEIPVFLRAAAAGELVVLPEPLMTKRYAPPDTRLPPAASRLRAAVRRVLSVTAFAWRFERGAFGSTADEVRLLCRPGPARFLLLAYFLYRIRVADLLRVHLRAWWDIGRPTLRQAAS